MVLAVHVIVGFYLVNFLKIFVEIFSHSNSGSLIEIITKGTEHE